MKPTIAIAILFSSFLLWAQTSGKAPEEQSGSIATICIYRPHRFEGSALKPSVYLDQVEIGRLHNGESVQVSVSAGQHRVNSNDKSTGIDLDAKAGETYYVRVEIKTGAWKGHGAVTLIDAQEGKYEFSQQKLTLTRDLTSNQGTAAAEGTNSALPSTLETDSSSVPTAVTADEKTMVSVTSIPDGAEIYVDGTFVGNAPAYLKLSAGKHAIRIAQPDYKDWTREIGVQAGTGPHVVATLEKK
jgi:hypothetical protein